MKLKQWLVDIAPTKEYNDSYAAEWLCYHYGLNYMDIPYNLFMDVFKCKDISVWMDGDTIVVLMAIYMNNELLAIKHSTGRKSNAILYFSCKESHDLAFSTIRDMMENDIDEIRYIDSILEYQVF